MKKGDWILYNNKRKKCFGIHHNGNILIKMNGTLVQVNKNKCKTYHINMWLPGGGFVYLPGKWGAKFHY